MDALVCAALHEIAVEGTQGCSLPKLWAGLQAPAAALEIGLDTRGRQMLWKQVLDVPGMAFVLPKSQKSQTLEASHPSVQSVQESEKLGVSVVAPEGLRESCLGLYDGKLSDASISKDQRDLLERLAKARSQGVTQSQLGKDFGTGGNKMFYVVKSLEARGLVVRHATIVRTHQPATKKSANKFVPIVATNLVHLTRYVKDQNLGSHMRFEIPSSSKSNLSNRDASVSGHVATGEEEATEEVVINDDYPAMGRICEKLEAAEDKVLVVSDLKLSLDYRFAQGHRTWRRLAKRLQDAGLVEIFNAQIAGSKIVPCIRLLKAFDSKAFSPGTDDAEAETQLRGVKRGQITEQVVESTLDRQIYDLIDNAGPAGLYMMDMWKQLGLNNKRNYFRVTNMIAKGCIVSEAEQHKRSMLYRLRTAPNAALAAHCKSADGSGGPDHEPQSVVPLAKIAPTTTIRRTRKVPVKEKEKEKEKEVDEEIEVIQSASNPAVEDDAGKGLQDPNESRAMVVLDLDSVKVDEEEPFSVRQEQMYPCPLMTTTAIQREQRLMQRLQEEKFIPRVELHRWIEVMEKDRKDTMMDRKTLTRLLKKLQREGRVKCIILSMPGLTNCGRSRTSEVVLLPEVEVGADLLARVHDRIRQFDMINRGYGSSKAKADAASVPVLTSVTQMHKGAKKKPQPAVEMEAEKAGRSLSANGFVPAKMVRVRMLHSFLWSYVTGISEYADEDLVMTADETSCRVFSLALAIRAMPLDLFLQVIGSTKSMEELDPYLHKELRLCDLSEPETSSLLGPNASGRLSWLIDVLRRLKLIRLVMGTGIPLGRPKYSRTANSSPEASLIYAMEIQPYIEEPAPQPLSSLSLDAFDLTPRARHEFTMTSNESLEAYWQTLEYFFSGAMPTIARRAFPGSNVPELFGLRSWTSLRLMTYDQRKKLMKRVEAGGEEKRMTATECAAVAKELNLSLEQVLRVSYEKNRRHRLQFLAKMNINAGDSDNEVTLGKGHRIKANPHAGSRKRAVTDADITELAHVKAYKRQRQMEQGPASENPNTSRGILDILLNSDREEDNHETNEEEGEGEEEEDKGAGTNPFNYLGAVTKLKPVRCKRFPWTEDLDRILICCYARQRAILGARCHRVDWASTPSLPANPAACRRRMAQLKSEPSVRKALMNLCSILTARYLNDTPSSPGEETDGVSDGLQAPTPPSSNEDADADASHSLPESARKPRGQEKAWDSFDEPAVAAALNEVMQLHSIAKAMNSKRSAVFRTNIAKWPHQQSLGAGDELLPGSTGPTSLSSMIEEDSIDPSSVLSIYPASTGLTSTVVDPLALSTAAGFLQGAELLEGAQMGRPSSSGAVPVTRGRPKSARVRKRRSKAKPRSLHELTSEEVVQGSLGVANAVELVKLVLLNSSSVAEVPAPVVEALRRCDETHVFAAFNYLREQELVIVGIDNQPFVLSPKFFHNAAASQFPFGTGIEALNTTRWLAEHDAALEQDWVPLPMDNFCGQLLQLLGVIGEGTVTISPFLPTDGVGESEDNKNVVVGIKRKIEGGQEVQFVKPKIQRADASTPGFRRERGFPGIQVCLHRAAKPVGELLLATVSKGSERLSEAEAQLANQEMDLDTLQEVASVGVTEANPTHAAVTDQAMDSEEGDMSPVLVGCIRHFCHAAEEISDGGESQGPKLKHPLLKAAACAIEDAGKEGLSISQLTHYLTPTDLKATEELAEACVDALESFGLVKQVKAFDHVRVIAAVHSGPFFLKIARKRLEEEGAVVAAPTEDDSSRTNNQVFPLFGEGPGESGPAPAPLVSLSSLATAAKNWNGLQSQAPPHLLRGSSVHRRVLLSSSVMDEDTEAAHTVPMLPWLNGDGSTNSAMLDALFRRAMGIVMVNPGIPEEHLLEELDVLNPQTARQLLTLLESDGHLSVRKLLQGKPPAPPRLLGHLSKAQQGPGIAKPTYRRHYYANATSAILL